MPLLIAPYTLGAFYPAAPAGATGGAAYYIRRKKFLMYMLASIVMVLVVR